MAQKYIWRGVFQEECESTIGGSKPYFHFKNRSYNKWYQIHFVLQTNINSLMKIYFQIYSAPIRKHCVYISWQVDFTAILCGAYAY